MGEGVRASSTKGLALNRCHQSSIAHSLFRILQTTSRGSRFRVHTQVREYHPSEPSLSDTKSRMCIRSCLTFCFGEGGTGFDDDVVFLRVPKTSVSRVHEMNIPIEKSFQRL